jgi:hypothetical protein
MATADNIGSVYADFRLSMDTLIRDINDIQRRVENDLGHMDADIALNTREIVREVNRIDRLLNDATRDRAVKVHVEKSEGLRGLGQGWDDVEELFQAAIFTAAIPAATIMGLGFIQDLNKEIERMQVHLQGFDASITKDQLKSLGDTVRETYSMLDGQVELPILTRIIQDSYKLGKSVEQIRAESTALSLLSKSTNVDFTELAKSYDVWSTTYKDESPKKNMQNFAVAVQDATQKSAEGLFGLNQELNKLKEANISGEGFAALTIRMRETGIQTDVLASSLAGLNKNLNTKDKNTMDALAQYLSESTPQKALVDKLAADTDSRFVKLDKLSKDEQQMLVNYVKGDLNAAETLLKNLRQGKDKTVKDFVGSGSTIGKALESGSMNVLDVLKKVSETYNSLSTGDRLNLKDSIGMDNLSLDQFDKLIATVKDYDKALGDVRESGGKIFDKMTDESLVTSFFDKLKSRWAEFLTSDEMAGFMLSLEDAFNKLYAMVDVLLQKFQDFVKEHPELAKNIVIVTVVVLSLFAAFLTLAASISFVMFLVGSITTVFGGLGKAIFTLGAFIVTKFIPGVWGALKPFFTLIGRGLTILVESVGGVSLSLVGLMAFIIVFWDEIMASLERNLKTTMEMGSIWNAIGNNWGLNLIQGFTDSLFGDPLSKKISEMIGFDPTEAVKYLDKFKDTSASFGKLWQTARDGFTNDFNMFNSETGKKIDGMIGDFKGTDIGKSIFGTVDSIKGSFDSIGDSFAGVKDVFKDGYDAVKDVIGAEYDPKKEANKIKKALDEFDKIKPPGTLDDGTNAAKGNSGVTPAQVTNNNYHPYDPSKVNNKLKSDKRNGDLSVGRRAVPSCG